MLPADRLKACRKRIAQHAILACLRSVKVLTVFWGQQPRSRQAAYGLNKPVTYTRR
jgi:hypothetical protein